MLGSTLSHIARISNLEVVEKTSATVLRFSLAAFPARLTLSVVELVSWIFILLYSGSVSEMSGSLSTVFLFPGGDSLFPPIGFAEPPIGFAEDPIGLAEDPGG